MKLLRRLCEKVYPDLKVGEIIEIVSQANMIRIEAVHSARILFTTVGKESALVLVQRDDYTYQELSLDQLRRRVQTVKDANIDVFKFATDIGNRNRKEQGNETSSMD